MLGKEKIWVLVFPHFFPPKWFEHDVQSSKPLSKQKIKACSVLFPSFLLNLGHYTEEIIKFK